MIPVNIQKKAAGILNKFISGEKCLARKGTNVNYLAIDVGYRYRLICWSPEKSTQPNAWQLLTHEAYNKVTRRPKQ